jgi:Lar family restriction alleviation protein
MTEKLLPCPFCGSAEIHAPSAANKLCLCAQCNAEGPIATNKPDAIAAWNRRAQAADLAGDEALIKQVLAALRIGRDSKWAEAQGYHAAMAGYRPQAHKDEDDEVAQIDAAIERLASPPSAKQEFPHCQNGGNFCRAGQRDGVTCPEESCDIDDGLREKDASPPQSQPAAPTAQAEAVLRSDKDYAIEHAEYMAKSADRLIAAVNDLALAEQEHDEGIANESDVDAARETLAEATRSLNSDIYEFRKRRARALVSAHKENGNG